MNKFKLLIVLILLLTACTELPDGLKIVEGFNVNRYLGTWYEIARLDHRFERGLSKISATYTLRDDGGIDVLNQGWNIETSEWKKAIGIAYFIDKPDEGRLKVSFFGPFYGAYNIIALDKENYDYAMIAGPDRSYLWLLSRNKHLDRTIQENLINQAKLWKFDTDKLIFTEQE